MSRALLALLLLLPSVVAQPGGAIDGTILLTPGGPPIVDAPAGLVRLNDSVPGERYRFDLTLERAYATFEVRAEGFQLERARQLVPSLVVPETEYPLFHDFPNDRIWEVDGPANVVHANGTGDALVLRLGVAGPRNVTLVLEVDTTPPTYTLGERQALTHIGFYQETRTNELAYGDLQIRRAGTQEWIRNPTPALHVLQRFPVQGMDAETTYETRVVFEDWAGNEVASPIATFVTPPAPVGPTPIVRILSPAPNATLAAGTITLRAAIESNESPVARDGVRLFFDKREVTEFAYEDGELLYTPTTAVGPGRHSVAVEATNLAGGKADARWSFDVEDPSRAPMPSAILALALSSALALVLARARRG